MPESHRKQNSMLLAYKQMNSAMKTGYPQAEEVN